MTASEEPSRDSAPRATCPVCAGTRVGAASLADRFVYLRCADCGEVWSIVERRHDPTHVGVVQSPLTFAGSAGFHQLKDAGTQRLPVSS